MTIESGCETTTGWLNVSVTFGVVVAAETVAAATCWCWPRPSFRRDTRCTLGPGKGIGLLR